MSNKKWIVEPKTYIFAEDSKGFELESGKKLSPVEVQYETYGVLSPQKDNAILILHAFSGDAHAAGYHKEEDKYPGWWDDMIGPGKPFDTQRFFIICSNVLGGCQGTTGPGSINPKTDKPYGMNFPLITIGDMVRVQKKLVEHLGIDTLLAVAGGSMGGMQAMEWAVQFPSSVQSAIVIASTTRLTAQGIAFNAVGRNAIMSDPAWNHGNYYGESVPRQGLSIARMVGHITYLSDEAMHLKFGRKLQTQDKAQLEHSDQFAVESYLEYQGNKFVDRFDANTYIYISRAMDYFDLEGSAGDLAKAFESVKCRFLVLSYSSDWLFPTYQSREVVSALMKAGKEVSFIELESPYGHDSFLLESERQGKIISSFMETLNGNK